MITNRGVHPSEAMMHFHLFQIPLFPKKIRTPWKIFTILPFLVIDHKFGISPLFSLFQYISPLFRENLSFTLLFQISPPDFVQFTCFYILYYVFRFPLHLCITQCTYWTPLITNT